MYLRSSMALNSTSDASPSGRAASGAERRTLTPEVAAEEPVEVEARDLLGELVEVVGGEAGAPGDQRPHQSNFGSMWGYISGLL